jgi:ABC-type Mn2+/Zn2+ transport system ATPase subunit
VSAVSAVNAAAAGGLAMRARRLTVRYGAVTALEEIDLDVPAGVRVAVLGPNGSGKSTLFAAAVGLLRPVAGSIEVASKRIAYLPQQLHVDPTFPITVRDVVAMGRWGELGWLRRPKARDRRLVDEAMQELGIAALARRRLSELSGGQRQRALVAQAHAQQADVLLLDEPYTGVDRPTADRIRELVGRWASEGRTVLVATHDLERSGRDFDLSLALNRRVVAFGPSAEVACDDVLRRTFGDAPAVEGAGHELDGHVHA